MAASKRHPARPGGQPDGIDVNAVLTAIFVEFGVAAELHLYQDLTNRLVVECLAEFDRPDGTRLSPSFHLIFDQYGRSLDVLMMQVGHSMYHYIDVIKERDDRERVGG